MAAFISLLRRYNKDMLILSLLQTSPISTTKAGFGLALSPSVLVTFIASFPGVETIYHTDCDIS